MDEFAFFTAVVLVPFNIVQNQSRKPNTYSCLKGLLDERMKTTRQDRMVIGVFTGILLIRVEEIYKFVVLPVKYQLGYTGSLMRPSFCIKVRNHVYHFLLFVLNKYNNKSVQHLQQFSASTHNFGILVFTFTNWFRKPFSKQVHVKHLPVFNSS